MPGVGYLPLRCLYLLPVKDARPRTLVMTGQGAEVVSQKSFHVLADGVFITARMAGDSREAPTGAGEADHLQAFTEARGEVGRVGVGPDLGAADISQGYADHGGIIIALKSPTYSPRPA